MKQLYLFPLPGAPQRRLPQEVINSARELLAGRRKRGRSSFHRRFIAPCALRAFSSVGLVLAACVPTSAYPPSSQPRIRFRTGSRASCSVPLPPAPTDFAARSPDPSKGAGGPLARGATSAVQQSRPGDADAKGCTTASLPPGPPSPPGERCVPRTGTPSGNGRLLPPDTPSIAPDTAVPCPRFGGPHANASCACASSNA